MGKNRPGNKILQCGIAQRGLRPSQLRKGVDRPCLISLVSTRRMKRRKWYCLERLSTGLYLSGREQDLHQRPYGKIPGGLRPTVHIRTKIWSFRSEIRQRLWI